MGLTPLAPMQGKTASAPSSSNMSSSNGTTTNNQGQPTYGVFQWRRVGPEEMLPRGFEIKFDFETGRNYAHLPQRFCLAHKDPAWVAEMCNLAAWGEVDKLRRELARRHDNLGNKTPSSRNKILGSTGTTRRGATNSSTARAQASSPYGRQNGTPSPRGQEPSTSAITTRRTPISSSSSFLSDIHVPPGVLQSAAEQGQQGVIEMLIQNYACSVTDFDSCGQTALHVACKSGNEDVLMLLLMQGVKAGVEFSSGEASGSSPQRRRSSGASTEDIRSCLEQMNFGGTTGSEAEHLQHEGEAEELRDVQVVTKVSQHVKRMRAAFMYLENAQGLTPEQLLRQQDLRIMARRIGELLEDVANFT
ncbi:unnamed protein product [Amoebophrya sp. A25]|nr:unnamed protein product [Amoebophrya sp. A25]|eukprot:GSA25T00024800001.1